MTFKETLKAQALLTENCHASSIFITRMIMQCNWFTCVNKPHGILKCDITVPKIEHCLVFPLLSILRRRKFFDVLSSICDGFFEEVNMYSITGSIKALG